MLSEELIGLAKRVQEMCAETQNIEVKAANGGCPRRLYDTLSSFSNQDGGGVILFGLNEERDFEPVGVYDLQDLQKKVGEQCEQMTPKVRAVFTVAEFEGVEICSAEIPALDLSERPCYYSGAGRVKGSYVRVGDADLPMSDYEIYSYENFRTHQHDDERVVPRAEMTLMDQDAIEQFLHRMRRDRPGFAQLNREQAMEMMAITRGGQLTLAAVLNFGIYPQGYFPQLAITAVVVPGLEMGELSEEGARFLDNKRIEGTLPNMLEDALGFCMRNMKTTVALDPATATRIDRTEYPIGAIREAVLNALIHRDYSIYTEGTPIQIMLFGDRMEIHSPGGLYGRLTIEELGHGRPDLRNPALAAMAEFLLHTENRYSGIPTIRRAMKNAGLREPVFQNRRNEFVVILYNQSVRKEATPVKTSASILDYCKTPRSRSEIAELLGIKSLPYVMSKYIKPLVDEGQLVLTMPNKPQSRYQKYMARDAVAR